MSILSELSPAEALRRALVKRVRATFNDARRGEQPVPISDEALFPPDAVIRRVHGDVTTMMIGGVAALLMQMLHPLALAGVWEHSKFRDDMAGRLRRTARFIAITTYAHRDDAEATIAKVRHVHEHVRGTLADGTPYAASDPELLAWVHVCEALCFLDAWIRYREPGMTRADQDSYFTQAGEVARRLGADPVPVTRAEAEAVLARFRPALEATDRSREVARLILDRPPQSLAMAPAQKLTMDAAVDLLPGWARAMHGRRREAWQVPLVRGGAWAMAETLRWAFDAERANRGRNP